MKLFELKNSITLYHGTDQRIDSFKGIVYLTPDQASAEAYARGKANINKKQKAFVYEVELLFAKLKQCKTMQQIGTLREADIKKLRAEGYDGAFYDGTGKEPIPEYVPFYPEKIKIKKVHKVML